VLVVVVVVVLLLDLQRLTWPWAVGRGPRPKGRGPGLVRMAARSDRHPGATSPAREARPVDVATSYAAAKRPA
jgi:hypothetical protein